jgi:hypothetical protein
MVLIEDMVSRKHAKLTLGGPELTISDLGSTNGTFVNGEKVTSAPIKEGDRILIGTSILKLISIEKVAGSVVDPKLAQAALDRAAAQKRKTTGEKSAVQGRLEEVPLVDLLQLLSTSKKTGAIVIKGYRSGRVHLRGGKVVSAVIDAGLILELLREYDYTMFPRWPFLEKAGFDTYRLPEGTPRLPLMYSLRARRSEG